MVALEVVIRSLPTDYMDLLFKSYEWMYNKLIELNDINNKTILCLCENGAEFLYEYMRKWGQATDMLSMTLPVGTVKIAKQRLDALGNDYKILYIASYPQWLPLKNGIVDIFIDDCSTFFDSFDSNQFLIEKLNRLFKPDAVVCGLYLSYKRKKTPKR